MMKINNTTDDINDKYTKYLNVKNDSTDYYENLENETIMDEWIYYIHDDSFFKKLRQY